MCVPLPPLRRDTEGRFDVTVVAQRLGMPIATKYTASGRWGPARATAVSSTARMPELELQDFDGNAFHMASVRGRKVVLIAWASW